MSILEFKNFFIINEKIELEIHCISDKRMLRSETMLRENEPWEKIMLYTDLKREELKKLAEKLHTALEESTEKK